MSACVGRRSLTRWRNPPGTEGPSGVTTRTTPETAYRSCLSNTASSCFTFNCSFTPSYSAQRGTRWNRSQASRRSALLSATWWTLGSIVDGPLLLEKNTSLRMQDQVSDRRSRSHRRRCVRKFKMSSTASRTRSLSSMHIGHQQNVHLL